LLLNKKNLNEIKLKVAIIGTSINLAYLASKPDETKNFKRNVLKLQSKIRLNRYFIPDFECIDSRLKDQKK
jgi:hypothetical protein